MPQLRLQRLEDGRCLERPRHLLRLLHPLYNRNFFFSLCPFIHLPPPPPSLIITSTTSVTTSTIAVVLFCLDEACLYQPKEEEEEAAEEQETVQLSVGATAAHGDILHQRLQQLPNINKKDEPKKKTQKKRGKFHLQRPSRDKAQKHNNCERERKKTTKKNALRKKPIATD